MGINGNEVPNKNGKRRKVIDKRNVFSLNTQTVSFMVNNIQEKKVFILNTYMSEKSLTHVWFCVTPSPWNSPGQNTGVGSLSLLQGIFPIQGSNPGLPHCRWILYQLSHKGNPRILEWVAYPFTSRSSHTRNWTRVSCIVGGFFTNWAIREALNIYVHLNLESICVCLCGCIDKFSRLNFLNYIVSGI